MEIAYEFKFEASHILPNHPGKCSNLHGHSWELTVAVEGIINKETGMVMDYAELKEKVQPLIDDLDHSHLGVWETSKVTITNKGTKYVSWLPDGDSIKNPPWVPTSENLLMAIGVEMLKRNILFSRLHLKETAKTACYLELGEVINFRLETIGVKCE